MLHGWVYVDNQIDVVDVHAAGSDIGGDQDVDRPITKCSKVAIPGRLGQVSVQINGGDARFGECLRQLFSVVFGAHEENSSPGARGEFIEQLLFRLGIVGFKNVVSHLRHGGVLVVDSMHYFVLKKTLNQFVDAIVQCCREEQALAARGRGAQDLRHNGQKAQVCHVVCFIQHSDFDGIEVEKSLPHQVFYATRCCHNDFDSVAQRLNLARLRHPSEDGRDAKIHGFGQGAHDIGDLGGKFACGGKNQTQRASAAAVSPRKFASKPCDHRDAKGKSLAGTGFTAAQNVFAGESVGQSIDLDGKRSVNTHAGESGNNVGGHAKLGKRFVRHSK